MAWAQAHLHTKWQPIHPTVWPQYTNVTDRQDRQTRVRLDRANSNLGDRLQNGSPYAIGPLSVCPVCHVRAL